jgi:DivIVA domain-containing protein
LNTACARDIIGVLGKLLSGGSVMMHPRLSLFERLAQAEAGTASDDVSDGVVDGAGEETHAMIGDDIRAQRFSTRLWGGLHAREVTAFLDEVADAVDSTQRQNIELKRQVRVLHDKVQALTASMKDAGSIPHALPRADSSDLVAMDRDAVEKEAAIAGRLEALRSAALQEVEALLHDAQTRTQALTDAAHERAAAIVRDAEALKCQRQQEAEALVAEATVTADSIVTAARDQEAMLRREIDRLADSRLRLFDDVRATVEACGEWLATVDPRPRHDADPTNLSGSVTNGALATADESPVG